MINLLGIGVCGIVLVAWAIEELNILEWEVWEKKEESEVEEQPIKNNASPNEYEIFV